MLTISKDEIMKQTGYSFAVSARIIREAKMTMVEQGYPFYANKRLNRVPLDVVNQMLGYELQGSESFGGTKIQEER